MEDNITEDYVSFDTAKLLKEKGFDEKCFQYWHEKDNELVHSQSMHPIQNISNPCFFGPAAPTLQRAMKWLRKSYNITVLPDVRIPDAICGKIESYWVGIWYVPKNNGGALCFISPTPENGYSSYEEACEAGIKYSLEHLI